MNFRHKAYVCAMGLLIPLQLLQAAAGNLQDIARFNKLVEASEVFNNSIGVFPTINNRIVNVAGHDEMRKARIGQQAQQVWPIMHTKVKHLIENFLQYKVKQGTSIEQQVYSQYLLPNDNVDTARFIDRLLTNRPLVFYQADDQNWLRGNNVGRNFETIGTEQEQAPLVLKDYISYDEMPISALLGVSVPTYFINDGDRFNAAQLYQKGTYQEEGVYVGLVGARFEKRGELPEMESRHMLVMPDQNRPQNGYGSRSGNNGLLNVWQDFYDETFPTYEQAQQDQTGRYLKVGQNYYLDTRVYKKRMRYVLEPFFMDADRRAQQAGKKAYCFVVGLGLGVWAIAKQQQENYFVEVCSDILEKHQFPNIQNIEFSWFNDASQGVKDRVNAVGQKKGINIHFTQNNPAKKLDDPNQLLVAMYAWDSNSYPGNEYWVGVLDLSGDPAAACSSTIAELQNPLINKDFVSGQRLQMYPEAPGMGKQQYQQVQKQYVQPKQTLNQVETLVLELAGYPEGELKKIGLTQQALNDLLEAAQNEQEVDLVLAEVRFYKERLIENQKKLQPQKYEQVETLVVELARYPEGELKKIGLTEQALNDLLEAAKNDQEVDQALAEVRFYKEQLLLEEKRGTLSALLLDIFDHPNFIAIHITPEDTVMLQSLNDFNALKTLSEAELNTWIAFVRGYLEHQDYNAYDQ